MLTDDKHNITKTLAFLFIPFLFLSLLTVTSLPNELREIGRLSSNLILYIGVFILICHFIINRNNFNTDINKLLSVYISFILLGIVYIISHFYNKNFYEDTTLLTLFLTFLLIVTFMNVKWTRNHIIIIGILCNFIILFLILHWYVLDFPTNRFKSIWRNPNGLGIVTLIMLFFQIISIRFLNNIGKIIFLGFILLNLIIMYSTTSRTVWISLIVILISFVVYKHFNRVFSYLFIITLPATFLFVFLYIKLQDTTVGNKLNDLSLEIFSKNFFSGRSDLWYEIWNGTLSSLWLGHGVGTRPRDIADVTLTAHNQYLQIIIDTGLIGLAAFSILLFFIWKILLSKLTENPIAKWSACFFIGILVYQSLEVSLFLNNPSYSHFQWLIISIGIGFVDKTSNFVKTN